MNQNAVTFDILSDVEFEQFTYDLLAVLGFFDLNWRKGTGLRASPSDQGRDIEGKYRTKAPDGTHQEERWFVECKHHKQGVPPKELEAALSWAQAKRPDKLLFVASNFLSNPAKEFLKQYEESNRPPFKIQYWELPKLRSLSSIHTQLVRKYGLLGEFPLLALLHPSHIRYLKLPAVNSLKHLFDLLDALDPADRNEILGWTMDMVINPRFRDPPPDYKGTIGDLRIDKVDYPSFKAKCHELARMVSSSFVVTSVVNHVLQYLLHFGDSSSLGTVIENNRAMIRHFQECIQEGDPEADTAALLIPKIEQIIDELPDQTRRYYQLYVTFCERVVGPLFDERMELRLPKYLRRPTRTSTFP